MASLVQQQFNLDPFTNSLFLFCGRRRDRIKALYWEGNGFVLLYKRLECGSFQWPRKESEARALTPQQYRWLMERLSFLFDEAEVYSAAEKEENVTSVTAHKRHKKHEYTLDSIPEGMSTKQVEHHLEGKDLVCPQCGDNMTEIGKEVVRTLEIIPAQMVVREDIYYTYACQTCNKEDTETPVVKSPKEKNIIPGSFATPEAVAHIMTQKFVMGSPLYRQEQEMNRKGIHLSRQTMSNWILKATEEYLTPVYEHLHKELLERDVLHADETTLQVLHEPGKKPQSESYMWLYRTGGDTDNPIVLYEYQPGRGAKHPKDFLAGYKGYLHADGYAGYHDLEKDIAVVGC